jgi:S1-C subfamily serine protease
MIAMSNPARSSLLSSLSIAALMVSVLVVGYFIGLHGPIPAALAPGKVAATEPGPFEPRAVAPREDLSASERSVIDLYERCSPSVVYVSPLREQAVQGDTPFTYSMQEVPVGTGSGFMWDKAGHIVTNFHVVQGASGALVTLNDRSTYRATKVFSFPDKDLAVLTIDAPPEKLVPLAIGTSKDLQVGQFVFAIGNPYGLDTTLTHGLISALGREMESVRTRENPNGRTIHDVIQTDAAINPGNSGGPLLDSSGRLIGVNTQIYSTTGASVGIGFAIPVDDVRRIVDQLIEKGVVVRPGLGIEIAKQNELFKLNRLGVRLDGVLVTAILPGGAAEKAGLRGAHFRQQPDGSIVLGDVITQVDDERTPDENSLRDALEARAIGQTVQLAVQRGHEQLTVPVTLQALDS